MQKKKQNNKKFPHFDTDLTSSYGYYGIENELFSVLRWVPPSILPNRFKDQKADLYNIWVLCTASTFVESDGCVRTSSLISSGMKNPWVFFGPLNWFFQAWVFFDNLKKPDIYRDSCRFWEKQTTYPYLFCGFDTFPLSDRYLTAHVWQVIEPKSNPKEALVWNLVMSAVMETAASVAKTSTASAKAMMEKATKAFVASSAIPQVIIKET